MKMFNFCLLLIFSMTLSVNSLQAQTPACSKAEKATCTKAAAAKTASLDAKICAKKCSKATAKSAATDVKSCGAKSAKTTAKTVSAKKTATTTGKACCSKGAAAKCNPSKASKSTVQTVNMKTVSKDGKTSSVKNCDPEAKTCNGVPCPVNCCAGKAKAKSASVMAVKQ